jgi:micrococcal nuclease
VKVVDGDTIRVRVGTRTERVRLIGIDTPELQNFGKPAECGGAAATRALRRLAFTPAGRGRSVRLVADPTQDRRDRYDRLLAYAEIVGGPDLGEAQVQAGWARVYVYRGVPFQRAKAYGSAEREARRSGRGAWSRCP